ncbi:MAG: helix-turn-helix transcriptional regulator [Firmicutes bacterium]|uniref:Helix-turn-helix transcriptional regulator n=1 Tax=Candidatus Onthovivens merdipullorum TaxID=2840889 RepID=A0A9D9DGL8_9BACL|nr:helix-turn-helix transcriptional regulator [Candidatus Onthovivens merdipullorum]
MKKEIVVLPQSLKILETLGNNLKLARLRRGFTMELICERANISRTTLWQIEKGNPTISIGYYINVLHALGGFENDLLNVAKDDVVGKTMQDLNLIIHKRGRK